MSPKLKSSPRANCRRWPEKSGATVADAAQLFDACPWGQPDRDVSNRDLPDKAGDFVSLAFGLELTGSSADEDPARSAVCEVVARQAACTTDFQTLGEVALRSEMVAVAGVARSSRRTGGLRINGCGACR